MKNKDIILLEKLTGKKVVLLEERIPEEDIDSSEYGLLNTKTNSLNSVSSYVTSIKEFKKLGKPNSFLDTKIIESLNYNPETKELGFISKIDNSDATIFENVPKEFYYRLLKTYTLKGGEAMDDLFVSSVS